MLYKTKAHSLHGTGYLKEKKVYPMKVELLNTKGSFTLQLQRDSHVFVLHFFKTFFSFDFGVFKTSKNGHQNCWFRSECGDMSHLWHKRGFHAWAHQRIVAFHCTSTASGGGFKSSIFFLY